METVTSKYVGRTEYSAAWEEQKRFFNALLTPNETVADKRSRYCSSSNTRTSIRSAKAGTRRTCWSTTVS